MKKTLVILGLAALAFIRPCVGQNTNTEPESFVVTTNMVATVTVPPATWRGSNAMLIAAQLAAVTNADGTAVFQSAFLPGITRARLTFHANSAGTVWLIGAQVTPPTVP